MESRARIKAQAHVDGDQHSDAKHSDHSTATRKTHVKKRRQAQPATQDEHVPIDDTQLGATCPKCPTKKGNHTSRRRGALSSALSDSTQRVAYGVWKRQTRFGSRPVSSAAGNEIGIRKSELDLTCWSTTSRLVGARFIGEGPSHSMRTTTRAVPCRVLASL